MNAAENFFYEHAGFSYDPKTQTADEGKRACAVALAAAESNGREAGLSFDWSEDHDSKHEWLCSCFDAHGRCIASLGGVDFGRDGSPHSSTYARVVEAELAIEALT